MAAGLVPDSDGDTLQIRGRSHRRIRGNKNSAGRNRVRIRIELPVPVGGGDVYRPVASATDIAGTASFEGLVSSLAISQIMLLGALGANRFAELVIEAFLAEITFGIGHPFL